MKKLLVLLAVIVLSSCEKDGYFADHYSVQIWYGERMGWEGPEHLIEAPNGFSADMGEMITLIANDGEGYRFLGWRKMPEQYCAYTPIVDEDNPRVCYIYMDQDYIGNCNIPGGLENVKIMAQYIPMLN